MFFLDVGMAFAAKIADAAPPGGTGKRAVGSRHQQELSVTLQMRPILKNLLAVKLLAFDGRIAAVTSIASDVVANMDALFPFLHDGAELPRGVLMAGHTCIVFIGVVIGGCTCA